MTDLDTLFRAGVYAFSSASVTNLPPSGADPGFIVTVTGYDANSIRQSAINIRDNNLWHRWYQGVWSGWEIVGAPFATQAEAEAGTNNARSMTPLRTKEAIAALPGGMTLIATADALSDATIEFTQFDPTKYAAYMLTGTNVKPSSDGAALYMRTSTDGGVSFDSAASDYEYLYSGPFNSGISQVVSGGAPQIQLSQSVGGAAGEEAYFRLIIMDPDVAASVAIDVSTKARSSAGTLIASQGIAHRKAAADVNAVQFLFSAGTIVSGRIRLWGIPA